MREFSILEINTDDFFSKACQIIRKIRYSNMEIEAGFKFVIFLVFFGHINYMFMLKRYENDLKKRKITQKNKILGLYPKGTFVRI